MQPTPQLPFKSDFVRLVRSNSLSYNKIGKKANNPQTFDHEPDLRNSE